MAGRELDAAAISGGHPAPQIWGLVQRLSGQCQNIEAYIVGFSLEVLREDNPSHPRTLIAEVSICIDSLTCRSYVNHGSENRTEKAVLRLRFDMVHCVVRNFVTDNNSEIAIIGQETQDSGRNKD
jgi:hypothetical protein